MLSKIDGVLVQFSRLFGTGILHPPLQIGTLLIAFTLIHSAAFYTSNEFAWILLWLGYLGILGVGRAWVANEKQRTAIARKLSDTDPDALPDLRISALLSALQLLIIIPLLMRSSHSFSQQLLQHNMKTMNVLHMHPACRGHNQPCRSSQRCTGGGLPPDGPH